MYLKWLIILILALSSMTAMAEQSVAEVAPEVEALAETGERSSLLKSLQQRARIDKNRGLRFNVVDFDGGIMNAFGFYGRETTDTEIYITGPYVQGKLGMGFIIRW